MIFSHDPTRNNNDGSASILTISRDNLKTMMHNVHEVLKPYITADLLSRYYENGGIIPHTCAKAFFDEPKLRNSYRFLGAEFSTL